MRLDLIEPRLERKHRLRPQAKQADAGIIGHALVGDQARLEQRPQVATHIRGGRRRRRRELAGTSRLLAEKLDHAPARGIGEGLEEPINVICYQTENIKLLDNSCQACSAVPFPERCPARNAAPRRVRTATRSWPTQHETAEKVPHL